jgi:hypothetical protein
VLLDPVVSFIVPFSCWKNVPSSDEFALDVKEWLCSREDTSFRVISEGGVLVQGM